MLASKCSLKKEIDLKEHYDKDAADPAFETEDRISLHDPTTYSLPLKLKEEEAEILHTEELVEKLQESVRPDKSRFWLIAAMIITAISIVGIFCEVGGLNKKVASSISDATSTVISAGASGISQILDSIVGASSILLYILVLGSWFLVFASKYCNSIKLHLRSGTQGKEQPPEPSPEPSRENGVPHNISRDKISRNMETRHLLYQRPHLKWPQSQTLGQLMMDLIPTYNKIW